MERLASLILNAKFSMALCVLVLVGTAAFSLLAMGVEQDDDLLAFLPDGNDEVALFEDLGSRFGSLDVALVGIEAGDDLFSADFLGRLQRVTDALVDLESLSYALSITNLENLSPDPEFGGIKVAPLVTSLPSTPDEEEAIRQEVMANDNAVGNLVAASGDAILIYAFLVPGADPRSTAEQIRIVVDHEMGQYPRYWGGVPFVSTWIYNTTDRDMARLTPWAVLAIILVLMLTFRDLIGTALALVTTGMGIVVAHGTMALVGARFNIVLSSMPIILFAVGSAYSIHILSHYYAHREHSERDVALRTALVSLGPVIMAAGLTTVAGLLSFVMMDIEPMRSFGLFTALGIFTTLVLSLTFVPAVIRLTDLRRKAASTLWLSAAMERISQRVLRNRPASLATLAIVLLTASAFAGRVDARMDQSSFFEAGSPPALSERFLAEHFGGSQFIQVDVHADFKQPQVLRELRRIGDLIHAMDGVSDVVGIDQAVSVANEAMEGARRIPDSPQKVGLLFGLIQGNKAVSQLISDRYDEALMQIKVHSQSAEEVEEVLERIEALIATEPYRTYRIGTRSEYPDEVGARLRQLVAGRISTLLEDFDTPEIERIRSTLPVHLESTRGVADPLKVQSALSRFISSDECVAELPQDAPALPTQLAAALTALGPAAQDELVLTTIQATVLAGRTSENVETSSPPSDEQAVLIDDLEFSLAAVLDETWTQANARAAANSLIQAASIMPPPGDAGARFRARLSSALLDLDAQDGMLPATENSASGQLQWQVSGLPVLHRGLSRSVTANQSRSLSFALILVLILMSLFFRSFTAGMLASAPTVVTLILVFGAMGAMGVHLDIGTSMLSSIIIGAGVDYGVHLLAGWRTDRDGDMSTAACNAARTTSEAIWTNAAMVAIGFFVLTLGEAKPLQNVGSLTATAMVCAAAATFIVIPMLARRSRYTDL
jgi:predicted RND superfamily exporter protein